VKVQLLPRKNIYKANLHCHSTYSDGWLTPAELKDLYMSMGYSIVAFTDHEVCFAHNHLADENFLPITGYEMQIKGELPPDGETYRKVVHLVFYSKDPKNTTLVHYCPKEMDYATSWWYVAAMRRAGEPVEHRELSVDNLNAIIADAKKEGFLCSFAHPYWSHNDRRDYCGLKGLMSLEIYNSFNEREMGNGYAPQVYEEMLRDGQRISCIAADDNHNKPLEYVRYQLSECDPRDPRYTDQSGGGWVMIAADELKYDAVLQAMEQGDFYASTGPEIKDLYVEDDICHIECSPAAKIIFSSGARRKATVCFPLDGPLTMAEFKIFPQDRYLRITVVDEKGKVAETRAYWADEFRTAQEA